MPHNPHLLTTLGPLRADALGAILPHEHLFVDLRTPDQPGYAEADTDDVIRLMVPELNRIKALGITALVDCAPVGVGRRADILEAVSQAAQFPVVVPTGIYREPWVPRWAHDASEDALIDWMLSELTGHIENSNVQAAWIKLSAGDEGLTACETKILRAAARAAKQTQAVIGSHTIRGRVVLDQLKIIEEMGYTAQRFIAIHASAEVDFNLNLEAAKRGAWIEYDWIGGVPDEPVIERILRLLDAGFEKQVLLSHDRGWFDPAQPNGGTPKPYTHLHEVFLPKLRAVGVSEATIRTLTHTNPFAAFAR
ncbi:MAG: esterase [Anaerolineae bacterium]|nr:esterase [Anaerolineae bacterium]